MRDLKVNFLRLLNLKSINVLFFPKFVNNQGIYCQSFDIYSIFIYMLWKALLCLSIVLCYQLCIAGRTDINIYRVAALLKNYCKITSPLLHNYCVQIAGFCCNFHGVLSLTGEIGEDGHPFYRFDHHRRRRYVL